jgi:hypothetical protein
MQQQCKQHLHPKHLCAHLAWPHSCSFSSLRKLIVCTVRAREKRATGRDATRLTLLLRAIARDNNISGFVKIVLIKECGQSAVVAWTKTSHTKRHTFVTGTSATAMGQRAGLRQLVR